MNSVLDISATSAQVSAQMRRSFLASLGINGGSDPRQASTTAGSGAIPRVYGRKSRNTLCAGLFPNVE